MVESSQHRDSDRVELVVHVGDGKTGTSAIQRMLREHRGELAADGIQYMGLMFESAPVSMHRWQKPAMIEAFHKLPLDQAVLELGELLSACVDHAARAGTKRLIWSNESLLGRSAATIRALQSLSERVDVTIVAYVRRHDRHARSAYLQWGLKHKAYAGPLRGFERWRSSRRLPLAPKLRAWFDAFPDTVRLRNYDAVDDATRDFLAVIGVDPAAYGSARRNMPLSPAELVLRSIFNSMSTGHVAPNRFSKLFGSERVDFSIEPRQWMSALLPGESMLERVVEEMRTDIDEINALLVGAGQPPFDAQPVEVAPFELPADALSAAMMQMLALQAERVEALEQRVQALEDGRTGAIATQAANVVGKPQSGWPRAMPTEAVRDALAPSLGYFGAQVSDCLEVSVDSPVTGLRLSLSEPRPVFLNLRGLELLGRGNPVSLDGVAVHAAQSSAADDDTRRNGADNLLRKSGIHSKAEVAPWWEARFDGPVECDTLRVWNRSDGWGCRSRTLRIEVASGGGGWTEVHSGRSLERLVGVLDEVSSVARLQPLSAWPRSEQDARAWREGALSSIAAGIASGELALSSVPWRALLQLLDVWGGEDKPSDATHTLLAAFLLHQHKGKHGTSIKSFSLLLTSRDRLLRLQRELNALATSLGLGRYMLTRHGVKAEGMLRRDPDKFVAHMQSVLAALAELGRDPVIAYGTLLGAVRDKDFIAHDDDIDLMYRSDATSREEAEADVLRMKEAMKNRGYRVVDLLPNSLNLHVIDSRNGAVMDVFPCWLEDGRMQMHMESMNIRGIDPDALYPSREIGFRGVTLPAPARPEVFLEERYGAGWKVPDQFHEWPWPLKDGVQ